MKKIKTIIFDFDGVIADTLPFTFEKILEIAKFLKVKNLTEKQIINEIRSKDWKELLKKVHPAMKVYDLNKKKGGFTHILTIN